MKNEKNIEILLNSFKGGVIMDVTSLEEAKIAKEAGAIAIMVLEKVPADIRKEGGIARMTDPELIKKIKAEMDIPVMAKVRIGHFVEAQIIEALNIDFIDESEVLTRADHLYHINKKEFKTPFVCGARNLGEALRRINEGALMIRTKGEAGTGDVSQAVNHIRTINNEIKALDNLDLETYAKKENVPLELVKTVKENEKLPVVNFAAGGIATPADAALMMQLGCDGVFVGSGIFKSANPVKTATAIVLAAKHYNDPEKLSEISSGLGSGMAGINLHE